MRTIQILFISIFVMIAGLTTEPLAQTVVFGDASDPTKATGINNLEVGGTNYNVIFYLGQESLHIYGPYPGTFTFVTDTEAEAAVNAVNAALSGDGATAIGNINLPSTRVETYNIGYESFLVGALEWIGVWGGAHTSGGAWTSTGQTQWFYNLDARNWAAFTITTAVDDDNFVPQAFELLPNYPNPFNPSTLIQYYLPSESKVTLQIFNVNGALVKTLVDDVKSSGQNSAIWNGLNNRGQQVVSGMYFYRLTADGFSQTRKMMLLK